MEFWFGVVSRSGICCTFGITLIIMFNSHEGKKSDSGILPVMQYDGECESKTTSVVE